MNPDRWRRIEEIYNAALDLEPGRRDAHLAEACADDESLRNEIESLLREGSESKEIMKGPALEFAAKALAEDGASLTPADLIGRSVSHYRIFEKIGEGGMGEVFLAEDTNLNRRVAIKVLSDRFAHDSERLARFRREAELLASLNHPNIAAIYGLEESNGKRFIVMELVEGQTLAQRLLKGPLPVGDAQEVCRHIAEGLEAAHEKGVIHRDLKPGNVMITADEKVKILDFGLAKALIAESAAAASQAVSETMTRPGTILGTAAYMSPEQARGLPVDRRTDIWSFGCVLYEMLTGRRAFQGETVSDTIASILNQEPDWRYLPSNVSPNLRRVLERCLCKNLHHRIHDISDVRIDLEEILNSPAERDLQEIKTSKKLSNFLLFCVCLAFALLGTALLWRLWPSRVAPPALERVSIPLHAGGMTLTNPPSLAISRDGRTLVFPARTGEDQRLYVRRMDELEPRLLRGTENATNPFLSSNGEWVGYASVNKGLWKVPLLGGTPQPIASFSKNFILHGACWDEQDRILFSGGYSMPGLWSVPAEGGTPLPILRPPEESGTVWYMWPDLLPDNCGVVFTICREGNASLAAFSFQTREVRTLVASGSNGRYLPSGHLVYESDGQLWATLFDPRRLETYGPKRSLLTDVGGSWTTDDYKVSSTGTLAYIPASAWLSRLVWKDRKGGTEILKFRPRHFLLPTLSNDGHRLVDHLLEADVRCLWTGSVEGEPLVRLTYGRDDVFGKFTPDGKWVLFTSIQGGRYNMWRIRADGSGKAERLTDSPLAQKPTSVSPDGKILVFNQGIKSGDYTEIWVCEFDRPKDARPFVTGRHHALEAVFSPDARWIAYQSDESGRFEIYLRPYPGPDPKKQISIDGGWGPLWNPNGRELFFKTATGLMSTPMAAGQPAGPATVVFAPIWGVPVRDYSVSPDGRRFLLAESGSSPQINVVTNWFEELKRLVPTDKD